MSELSGRIINSTYNYLIINKIYKKLEFYLTYCCIVERLKDEFHYFFSFLTSLSKKLRLKKPDILYRAFLI